MYNLTGHQNRRGRGSLTPRAAKDLCVMCHIPCFSMAPLCAAFLLWECGLSSQGCRVPRCKSARSWIPPPQSHSEGGSSQPETCPWPPAAGWCRRHRMVREGPQPSGLEGCQPGSSVAEHLLWVGYYSCLCRLCCHRRASSSLCQPEAQGPLAPVPRWWGQAHGSLDTEHRCWAVRWLPATPLSPLWMMPKAEYMGQYTVRNL